MTAPMQSHEPSKRAARRRLGPGLAIVAFLALAGSSRPAEARDAVGAEALFRAGRDALRRGDYETACRSFEASQQLDPAGGTALNLAECEQGRGHVASAWQHLREALDLLPAGDDRIPMARARVRELEPRLPHLTIRLAGDAPSGTTVTRDDVEVTGAMLGFRQPLDPGHHVIRVVAPGRAERSYEITSVEGVPLDLDVEPGEKVTSTTPRTPMTTRRKVGLIVAGFGVAATGVGVAEGIAVLSRSNQKNRLCPDNVCPDAGRMAIAREVDDSGKTYALVSTIAFGVGLTALATGTFLAVTGGSAEKRPAIVVAPTAQGGAVIGVGGAF
jgi:hypothetical protein